MKRFFVNQLVIAAIAVSAALTSCDDKEDKLTPAEVQKEAIVSALENNSELSEFATALIALNFSGIEAEELTVFAVKNGGMSKSKSALMATGDDDFDVKRHVVKGKYSKSSLTDGRILEALDGSSLTISVKDVKTYINGVELGSETTVGNSILFVVEKAIPATAPYIPETENYSFTVYECNAAWSPDNNIPYLAASSAVVIVIDSLGRELDTYTTNASGKLTITLEKARYSYRVTKVNASNISNEGFLIIGIFTEQEELDIINSSGIQYPAQSPAVLGGLKFADLNGDGRLNNDDKPAGGIVSLLSSQDVYIAAADFAPTYKPEPPVNVDELKAQLQADFRAFVQQHYLVDAYIAQDFTNWDSISHPTLWKFTFNAGNSEIAAVWNHGYNVIDAADKLAESNAANDVKIDAAMKRAYALSVMYNYFGGLPLHASEGSRMSAQETADYIVNQSEILNVQLPQSERAKALMLKARILMNQPQPNFQAALNSLNSIENSGTHQLPAPGSFLPWGNGWTTTTTVESIWEGVTVGDIKKQDVQTYSYPMRYTETVLLLMECYIGLEQTMKVSEYNNMFRYLYGWDPLPSESLAELRESFHMFWDLFMFREGLRFAYLKRNILLGAKLDNNAKELLPIPLSALDKNPNLTQNPGY